MADTWKDCEIVFIPRTQCPHCQSPRPIVIRSERGGDGSTSRKCVCRSCSRRFVVVIEPTEENSATLPEFGKADF